MTLTDPFATAPADEAQAAPEAAPAPEPAPEPEAAPAKKPAAKAAGPKAVAAAPAGGKVTMTFKGGSGFDAPWIVIHADDLDDALEQVTTSGNTLAAVMERVQKAGAHFAGLSPKSNTAAASSGRPVQNGQPQGSVEAPSWAPPKPFDDFVYVTKVKAETGKTWHAWMPPEKGDSRPAKFFFPPR